MPTAHTKDLARTSALAVRAAGLIGIFAAALCALALAFALGGAPQNATASEHGENAFATILVGQEEVVPYTVLMSGGELYMSAADLAEITRFTCTPSSSGARATFVRGAKEVVVDPEGSRIIVNGVPYPYSDTGLGLWSSMWAEPAYNVEGTWYYPTSQVLPWLNVNCAVVNGVLYVVPDETSRYDLLASFDPASIACSFDGLTAELGDGSGIISTGLGFLDGIKTGIVGEDGDYYKLLKNLMLDKNGSASAAIALSEELESYEMYEALINLGFELAPISDSMKIFNGTYGYHKNLAGYAAFFAYVEIDDTDKQVLLQLILDSAVAGEELREAVRDVQRDFEDYWPGLLKQFFSDVANDLVDEAAMATPVTAAAITLVKGAQQVAEIRTDWSDLEKYLPLYEQLAAVGLDIYSEYKDAGDPASIANARRGALLYVYACKQMWQMASDYALTQWQDEGIGSARADELLELGYAYAARADEVAALEGAFTASATATDNDALYFGGVAGKGAYTAALCASYAQLDGYNAANATGAAVLAEYAILFAGLEERGIETGGYALGDADGDGDAELYVAGLASKTWPATRSYPLFADADGMFFYALPATYLDGTSDWVITADSFGFAWRDTCPTQPQAFSLPGTYDVSSYWNGYDWYAVAGAEALGSAWLESTDGRSVTYWGDQASALAALDEHLKARSTYVLDFTFDLDCDGVEDERLYLSIEDFEWLDMLRAPNDVWGDLSDALYAEIDDDLALAVTVNPQADGSTLIGACYVRAADLFSITSPDRFYLTGNNEASEGMVYFSPSDADVRAYWYNPSTGLLEKADWRMERSYVLTYAYECYPDGTEYGRTNYTSFDVWGNPMLEYTWSGHDMVSMTTHAYDDQGRLVSSVEYLTLWGDTYENAWFEYAYDEATGLLSYSTWADREGDWSESLYSYDAAGNLVLKTTTYYWGTWGSETQTDEYVYDELGRKVLWIQRGGDGTVWEQIEYCYDGTSTLPWGTFNYSDYWGATNSSYTYHEDGRLDCELRYYKDGTNESYVLYEYATIEKRVQSTIWDLFSPSEGGDAQPAPDEGAQAAPAPEGNQLGGDALGGWEPQVDAPTLADPGAVQETVNNGTAAIVFPASWAGAYIYETYDAGDGNVYTYVYSSTCYALDMTGYYPGLLFTVATVNEINWNWPSWMLVDSCADGRTVVVLFPTGIEFNPDEPLQAEAYAALSPEVEYVVNGITVLG